MKKIGYLLIVLLFLISGCHLRSQFIIPEKQFVYIRSTLALSACHKATKLCVPISSGFGYASGFLISNTKDKSYYMTAGHVCENDFKSKNEEFEAKFEKEIHLLDYDDGNHIATIIAVDSKHDICMLSTSKVKHLPVSIAQKKLPNHTDIINVAAPAGIWDKTAMLHFRGEFQGNRIKDEESQAMYTITAQPGSSGSPVFNPVTGKVTGMITHVLKPSFDIAFGPTTEQINTFIKQNLPE